MTDSRVALIVDIVRSRDLADRGTGQRSIHTAFDAASDAARPVEPLWATVGDEFQAVYDSVPDALRATTVVRLALPADVDCRFGLGLGETRAVVDGDTRGRDGSIQDGSAWWCARRAIDEAHRREHGHHPFARSWFFAVDPDDAAAGVVNAYLLMRDQAIGAMNPRERRLAAGTLLGRPQSDLARDEGITQSAVSQNLRRSGGAALLAAHQAMTGAVTE
ncbi:SatD family protein [Marisediminicola senii]|uniref:SatD family protein n=1 Tax=Marisediminicola senii TaxID=2711233 RepID=UPI0013EA41A3|nr:SatD family protein [Marisediminicola senii]